SCSSALLSRPTSYTCRFSFFFQAEDGIRDFHVTGVQTCALPILFGEKRAPLAMGLTGLIFGIPVFFDVGIFVLAPIVYAAAKRRSEERRVGKERRSRWCGQQ